MGAAVTRRACLAGAACAMARPAWAEAPDLVKQIATQLEQHAVVRAKFVQTRQMLALKRPLVSRGRMVFSRQDGMVWLIDAPLKLAYWLSEQRVVEIGADGARREQDLRGNPAMALVGRHMGALFRVQTETLRELFELRAEGSLTQWDLTLTPLQAQWAQFVRTLQVSGGRYIDALRIEERAGDVTTIRFMDSQASHEATPAELAAFTESR